MKLRNFLIVLFALLMVFAFASCKHEPKVEPTPEPVDDPWELYPFKDYTPTSNDVQVITITEGVESDYWNKDKLKIEWEEPVEAGDVITLKYRSERGIYQWDIRNGSTKWVYETDKNNFTDPVLGEGGWYTLTYTFADVDINGTALPGDTRFGIYFRGNFVEGDIFEIMDVKLNGEPLAIEATNIKSAASLAEETIKDHVWDIPRNYSVLLATGKLGEVDKTPLIEKVAPGSTAKDLYDTLTEDGGYIVELFTDADKTTAYDLSTEILKDGTIVYYTRTGVERTVKFDLNGGSADPAIADATVIHNQVVAKPATVPTKEGVLFAEWCTDAEGTKPYDFAKPVKGDLTLYARYGVPRTVTFNLNGAEGTIGPIAVPDGMTVARPTPDPTNGVYALDDWYLGTEVYDFAAKVTADIELRAEWSNKTSVTLNLNYTGAPEATSFKVLLDTPLDEDDENLEIVDRIGYVFGGWYDDAECTEAHNFTANVTAPVTLYAKWTEATLYRLVAQHNGADNLYSYDKIEIRMADAEVSDTDVLSFRYRTTKPNTGFSIRRATDDAKWIYQNRDAENNYGLTSYEAKDDGWIYVTYVFNHTTAVDSSKLSGTDESFYLHFYNRYNEPTGNVGIEVGDILEIQDFAINGVPLTIVAGDVANYAGATLSIVDGGSYAWTKHDVSFDTDVADAINPISVEYGQKLELPEDPTAEGYVFVGWFTDSGFTEPFDENARITEDIELYAKFGAKKAVSFDSNEGSAVATAYVAEGEPVAKPENPVKAEAVFGGWYTDNGTFLVAYDFATPVTADITLYARWVVPVTLTYNLNYDGAPAPVESGVEGGAAITQPKNPSRVGYFFGGWYQEAGCENAFDFASGIVADKTIYAKWTSPENAYKYTITATNSSSRFRWRFKASKVAALSAFEEGDVITFQVKFTATHADAITWKVSTQSSEQTIASGDSFGEADGNGWYSITAIVPSGITTNGLYVQLLDVTGEWGLGDIAIIKGLAFNGVAIPLPGANTEEGLYPGVAASVETIAP